MSPRINRQASSERARQQSSRQAHARRGDIAPLVVVLDWDGTVTEVDSLHLALERFGDVGIYERTEEGLAGGSMSYRDVMDTEMATIRAPLEDVVSYLLGVVRIRPGFRELVARYDPLIVSSGFEELIRPLLLREGLDVRVLANRVDARPDGWRVVWRDPFACETCGDLCKRRSLPEGEVVFVGDGYSDHCAALAADRVFAIGGLARYLDKRGANYETFTDFFDIARRLDDAAQAS
jgi:2-hydroxy-3-keto-5-methylthiopentenyl-1-phosphate phosphatase